MKRLHRTLIAIGVMALVFFTSPVGAFELDELPLDVALMSAEQLAEEAADAEFDGESDSRRTQQRSPQGLPGNSGEAGEARGPSKSHPEQCTEQESDG